MAEIVTQTVYFKESGEVNTARVFELARTRAETLGINTILVATTSGKTGAEAAKYFKGLNVVVVTHSTGFRKPNFQELKPEHRVEIETHGAKILTAQHALGGLSRAVRKKFGTYELDEIIANTFRIFGQGMKVVAEITLMAADAGLARTDEPAVVVAGTAHGADTACVVLPTHAQTFFDLRILEVICWPAPEDPAFRT